MPDERRRLAALVTGAARPATWRDALPPAADVFAAKGLLAAVLDTLRAPWSVESGEEPFLHPGKTGRVLVAGEPAGWIGELHPLVAREWDLRDGAAFEVDLDAVIAAAPELTTFRDVTAFPSVRQDLAVVVGDDVPASRVVEAVREAGGDLLGSAQVFDVYRGEQAGEGKVSLALRLEFRAPDRTLTDEEAADRRQAIEAALADRIGASLRA